MSSASLLPSRAREKRVDLSKLLFESTIADIDGQWMLLDGRNRREAARIAGVIPPFIVTDIDPKLAVHRSNNQNRDATPGQKAMAFAMQWPEATKGGDRKSSIFKIHDFDKAGYSRDYVSKARYVLRNNPPAANSDYPQYALDVMAGLMTLTEAYEATQKAMAIVILSIALAEAP